jgi:hypothetical protein
LVVLTGFDKLLNLNFKFLALTLRLFVALNAKKLSDAKLELF